MASAQIAKVTIPTREDKNPQPYWQQLARSYFAVGPPLQPSPEVVSHLERAVFRVASRRPGAGLKALLLGVTPAIAQMKWPDGTLLTAADYSLDMVRGVWPGNLEGFREAVCADWQALPLRPRSCDIAIGDGAMNCVRFPGAFRELAKNLHIVAHEDAFILLRCYVQPALPETPDDVFREAALGLIPTFHQFKFRLLTAMQKSTEQGVALDAVYETWIRHNKTLGERAAWSSQDIATIDLYRGSNTVHTFPTLAELRSVLLDYFDELEISYPAYVLSERCPILALKPRNG